MAAKRRARRPRSDDSKELGGNGGNEGSDDEESCESGEVRKDAIPSPLKRAEERSLPEDAGAQGSGEASPARGGDALKTATTASKRAKKPAPASQEEDDAAEDSGDATPARGGGPLRDDSADAGRDDERAATPKRGEKRSPPPLQEDERPEKRAAGTDPDTEPYTFNSVQGCLRITQEDERPEKRAAGTDAEAVAAKSSKRKKKKSKRAAEKDRLKKKKKKQLRKALAKLTSPPPQLLELEINDKRQDTPSFPEIAQEKEHHDTEMAEQDPCNTSPPQDDHEEEQLEKSIAEQEHAGGTSPPHDKDTHSTRGEEQLDEEEEVANQELADDTSTSPPKDNPNVDEEEQQEKTIAEQGHAGGTSPPHDKDTHSARGEEQLDEEEEVGNQELADDTSPSPPKDNHNVDEEEQQEKNIAEQGHAGDTSPLHDKDTHSARGEEQLDEEEEVANQERAVNGNHNVDEEEQPEDTSPPQEKNKDQEDEETGAQAVNGEASLVNNAPSTKLRGSEKEKKPGVERSWSYDDELKILNALVKHAQSHDGALPEASHLLANLTFDKIDANEEKLADKIRKLKRRYHKMLSQGCPSDPVACQLFKLSEKIWGEVDEDEQVEVQVEPTSRDFSAQSKLYPHLAKEVQAYARPHSSRDLIMAMFMNIGDEKARDLNAKCKKLQIEALKLELGQASIINELLSAASTV